MGTLEGLYAAKIIEEARRTPTTTERLARGAELRALMRQQIAEGETPTGYRADWLEAKARLVIELMGMMAQEFNAEHADDYISAADLLDLLATAESILKNDIADVYAARKVEA